jgi:DNA replication and repair protein RecF
LKLRSIAAESFRNLAPLRLTPSAHATVAVGQNGQGKTNLLEAIYFLFTLKPLRAGKLVELVRFGQERARVEAQVELGGAERTIAVDIEAGVRSASVDGKRTAKLEDYFGGAAVVAFTPDDLEVVKGAPEGRRTFLDRAVFNRFPAFLGESRAFSRALKGRNRLLKEGASADYLEAYDEALAGAGARVWIRRRDLLRELAPRAVNAFAEIGRTPMPAAFGYRPAHLELAFEDADEALLCEALREALVRRTARDRERGFTSVGPQADDLTLFLGDKAARAFASQGQQRALVLAWKIAEIENLKETLGFLPLLLLDDVSSELDPVRNGYLMDYLARSGAQVVLTTTDPRLVHAAAAEDTLWLELKQGEVRQMPPP